MLESRRSPRLLSVHSSTAENGEIQVTITNTGNVLTGDVLKQMFDPFFTTKSVAGPAGLGLAAASVAIAVPHTDRTDDGRRPPGDCPLHLCVSQRRPPKTLGAK